MNYFWNHIWSHCLYGQTCNILVFELTHDICLKFLSTSYQIISIVTQSMICFWCATQFIQNQHIVDILQKNLNLSTIYVRYFSTYHQIYWVDSGSMAEIFDINVWYCLANLFRDQFTIVSKLFWNRCTILTNCPLHLLK